MRHTQRGNILFLILLAVVLFAGLSYAVTSSTQGGGKNASSESLATTAGTILQTATLMENTVARLKLSGGCTDAMLSFEKIGVNTGYANNNAPPDKHCHVFDPAGGGMSWPSPPANAGSEPWFISGAAWFSQIGSGADYPPAAPDTSMELAAFLPIVSVDLCNELNAKLGNPAALAIDYILNSKFNGTYTVGNFIADDGGNAAGYKGRLTGCIQGRTGYYPYNATPSHPYFFYHILIAR